MYIGVQLYHGGRVSEALDLTLHNVILEKSNVQQRISPSLCLFVIIYWLYQDNPIPQEALSADKPENKIALCCSGMSKLHVGLEGFIWICRSSMLKFDSSTNLIEDCQNNFNALVLHTIDGYAGSTNLSILASMRDVQNTLLQCTSLLVEKAGVAQVVTCRFTTYMRALKTPWGSHEVQNRSNQWPQNGPTIFLISESLTKFPITDGSSCTVVRYICYKAQLHLIPSIYCTSTQQ